MATAKSIAIRREEALARIGATLGIETGALHKDPGLAEAMLLEHIAEAGEQKIVEIYTHEAAKTGMSIAANIQSFQTALEQAQARIVELESQLEIWQPARLQAAIDNASRDELIALVGVGGITADRMMAGRAERQEGEAPLIRRRQNPLVVYPPLRGDQ